jgi:hypothetical protein
LAAAANLIINASLAAWDIPLGWKWTCYILGGLPNGLGTSITPALSNLTPNAKQGL